MTPDVVENRPVGDDAYGSTAPERSARFTAVAPIVPVRNVSASISFYEQVLGFALLRRNADNSAALVARDSMRLMLLRVGQRRALEATREHISAYVWVDDVAGLWEELAPRLDQLPAWRVRKPFRQPYGAVEFHVKDPDGFLLFFAEDPTLQKRNAGAAGLETERDVGSGRPN
ncbi:MAG: VOC family protein [Pseudomonadota bacterium]